VDAMSIDDIGRSDADMRGPVRHPAITTPTGGELLDLGPIQARILEDGTTTEHRLAIAELIVPPHTDGPPQHWHARHDEGFFVLSEAARFTVGKEEHDAPAGTLVMVSPGAPHTFGNPNDAECRIINTFTPHFYVDYLRELAAVLADGKPLDAPTMLAIMARYETYPADTLSE
jgi:mannose-6-phosphate isomerase-like protein (cupin superfamily)